MPSALRIAASGSTEIATSASWQPASSPASSPSKCEPSRSKAPERTMPGVSRIVLMSIRPMRPPAPVTTSRMSAISSPLLNPSARLRAVIAFDNDNVADARGVPQDDGATIFLRLVAGERGRVILEFEHDMARVQGAAPHLAASGADEKAGAEFGEGDRIGREIGFVGLRVGHIDMGDPIA